MCAQNLEVVTGQGWVYIKDVRKVWPPHRDGCVRWLQAVFRIVFSSEIKYLDNKTSEYSGNPFDSRYFSQRVSMLIQRYNSILFRETFPAEGEIDT